MLPPEKIGLEQGGKGVFCFVLLTSKFLDLTNDGGSKLPPYGFATLVSPAGSCLPFA